MKPLAGHRVATVGKMGQRPLARYLVLKVVEQLCVLVPNEAEGLSVLRGELTWRALIGPLGGGV